MDGKKHYAIMMTVGEVCDLIENEMARLGRNITNEEVNELITKAAIERDAVIATSDKPMDADMLTGELREEGVKVRNINEEIRREEKKKGE